MSKDFYTFTAMDIQPDLVYTVKEASALLNVHPRKMTRIAQKHNLDKIDNRYLFTGKFLIEYHDLTNVKRVSKDVKGMSKDVKQETILGKPLEPFKTTNANTEIHESGHEIHESSETIEQTFSVDEYDKLQRIINGVPTLKREIELLNESLADYRNQVTYLQNSLEKQRAMVEQSMHNVSEALSKLHQQNYIEAKNKGFDVD